MSAVSVMPSPPQRVGRRAWRRASWPRGECASNMRALHFLWSSCSRDRLSVTLGAGYRNLFSESRERRAHSRHSTGWSPRRLMKRRMRRHLPGSRTRCAKFRPPSRTRELCAAILPVGIEQKPPQQPHQQPQHQQRLLPRWLSILAWLAALFCVGVGLANIHTARAIVDAAEAAKSAAAAVASSAPPPSSGGLVSLLGGGGAAAAIMRATRANRACSPA